MLDSLPFHQSYLSNSPPIMNPPAAPKAQSKKVCKFRPSFLLPTSVSISAMQYQRDSNPHFVTPPLSHPSEDGQLKLHPGTPRHGEHVQSQEPQLHHAGIRPQQPHEHPGTPRHGEHVQSQEPQLHHAGIRPQQPHQHPGRRHSGQQGYPPHRPSSLRLPGARKTRPVGWLIAAFCTLFWIIVIVAGLSILIIYLVFRPRLPKFDVSSATLNAAYLDMGFLLNADLTILGNFTNPNKKVNVDFSSVVMDLYHERALLATRYVEPFTATRRHSRFEDIHMITSQVPLTLRHSQELQRQLDNGRVMFDIKGYIRARSKLGGFLRYSYWLYSHCTITVTSPPTGVMIAKKCTTKR